MFCRSVATFNRTIKSSKENEINKFKFFNYFLEFSFDLHKFNFTKTNFYVKIILFKFFILCIIYYNLRI
nr:hypothetical protein CFF04554_0645 [Campylobacter fetus subsp. fetus 04/554]